MSPIKLTTNNRPAAMANGSDCRQIHKRTAKRSSEHRLRRHCHHSLPQRRPETRYRPPYGCSCAETDTLHDPLKSP